MKKANPTQLRAVKANVSNSAASSPDGKDPAAPKKRNAGTRSSSLGPRPGPDTK